MELISDKYSSVNKHLLLGVNIVVFVMILYAIISVHPHWKLQMVFFLIGLFCHLACFLSYYFHLRFFKTVHLADNTLLVAHRGTTVAIPISEVKRVLVESDKYFHEYVTLLLKSEVKIDTPIKFFLEKRSALSKGEHPTVSRLRSLITETS